MINRIFRLQFSVLLLIAINFAQGETGRISGTITEVDTKNKLPGVNIILKGTYYGSASNENGEYLIENIGPGNYDVEVSMIGYKVMLQTGIPVDVGKTSHIDFHLEKTV